MDAVAAGRFCRRVTCTYAARSTNNTCTSASCGILTCSDSEPAFKPGRSSVECVGQCGQGVRCNPMFTTMSTPRCSGLHTSVAPLQPCPSLHLAVAHRWIQSVCLPNNHNSETVLLNKMQPCSADSGSTQIQPVLGTASGRTTMLGGINPHNRTAGPWACPAQAQPPHTIKEMQPYAHVKCLPQSSPADITHTSWQKAMLCQYGVPG